MQMVPHKSTGMQFLATHLLSMVVPFPGVLTNKNSSPCPPLKPNTSHWLMPPRRQSGFTTSLAKSSHLLSSLPYFIVTTNPCFLSPPMGTFMPIQSTLTSGITSSTLSSKMALSSSFTTWWMTWPQTLLWRPCPVWRQSISLLHLDFNWLQFEGECWNSPLHQYDDLAGTRSAHIGYVPFYYLYSHISCYDLSSLISFVLTFIWPLYHLLLSVEYNYRL